MVVAFSVIWARTLLELPALTWTGGGDGQVDAGMGNARKTQIGYYIIDAAYG